MIDTVEVSMASEPVGQAEIAAFHRVATGVRVSGNTFVQAGSDQLGVQCQSWLGYVEGLGNVRLDRDGMVRMGRSLAKTRQELEGVPRDQLSNGHVLSAEEANETFAAWVQLAREQMPWLEGVGCNVCRADVVYQRQVGSSLAVVGALKGAVKPTRGGCAWFDNGRGEPTGVIFRGKSVLHRVYDKGLESGRGDLVNVLRSEEQLRRGSRGLERIFDGEAFGREECVAVLNERYLEVGFVDTLDVGDLLADRRYMEALFVLNPELLETSKAQGLLSRSSYFRVKRKVRLRRALAVPADLRVPEEGWLTRIA